MSAAGEIAIIILAAGESSRMGRPKQLLLWQGRPLLCHVAKVALSVPKASVHVVLGANQQLVAESLHGLHLKLCINERWHEGMGSSVRIGVQAALAEQPATSAVLFLLCDQPLITVDLLHELILRHSEGAEIAATSYRDTLGVPALFAASLYPELLALQGDQGAKKIIQRYQEQAAIVSFPEAGMDLDTFEDYEQAVKS